MEIYTLPRPSFESLFRFAPNAYVLLDLQLIILDANQAYLNLTGRSLEDICGKHVQEVFAPDPQHPESGQELMDSFARVLLRKIPDTLPVIRYPITCNKPEGPVFEERYWSVTHTPLLDEKGEVSAILQNTSDITELVCMKDQSPHSDSTMPQLESGVIGRALLMQDEGHQLRRLFAQAPGFVCFLRGPEHVFELVNEAYQDLTGRSQLIGKTVHECLPEIEQQGFIQLLDQVYESSEPFVGKRMRVLLQRRQGALDEVFIDFLCQPIIETDGSVSGIFVQGQDVTEQQYSEAQLLEYRVHLEEVVRERTRELECSEAKRRTAEAALFQAQKLEAIGKLTGGIAHAFNNMLQVIGGNLQLLRRTLNDDETTLRRLDAAVVSVDRSARLASQLLAFASRQPLQPQPVHLGELIERMSDLLDGSLGSGIAIELNMQDGLWPVQADVGNLESVILNLATNAGDAMSGKGRLQIFLDNRTLDEFEAGNRVPGDYVLLQMLDEGCGMTPEVQERAFEPFFSTKQNGSASGLGLSVVYGFIKQSGGFIDLQPRNEGGTAVQVYFPRCLDQSSIVPSKASGVVPQSPPAESVAIQTAGLRILFVEDDPTLRMLTGEVMAELGHSVTLGESAEVALRKLAEQHFDVLFTDIGLPGMSGLELARQVRRSHPQLGIVIASGYVVDAKTEGLESILTVLKPYDIDQVRKLLDGLQDMIGTAGPIG